MSKKITSLVRPPFLACILAASCGSALALVSADEAKKLGMTLTEFGAEKAGNADGSIPAYAGGLTKAPAGYTKNADQYVDPFKGDKPVFSIDAKNMAQYDALLTPGNKALLKRFPTYKVDVYPTRRSVAYPAWVIQNTTKNATTAKLSGTGEGDGVSGADPEGTPLPGVPFPIPKNGYEVMWNHMLHYAPAVKDNYSSGWLVDASGNITGLPESHSYYVSPFYDQSGALRKQTFGAYLAISSELMSPPSAAGTHFLNFYLPDASEGGQKVWFYTPGQRRVRAAPEFSYDIPIASYGGVLLWDEIFGFVGRMDRFDFKLIGKKEMIVPYNAFPLTNQSTAKEAVGPKHLNPEVVRWEKRRVWVVEADRKASARHVYSKRTFYVEEDCWCIVASETYDNANNIYRVGFIHTFPTYDFGGVNTDTWHYHDLIKGNYFVTNIGRKDPGHYVRSYDSAKGLPIKMTPQAVAGGGVR